LPSQVACEADKSVLFQETTVWQEPPIPGSIPFGASAFAGKKPAG
jgi:hypothetical protein